MDGRLTLLFLSCLCLSAWAVEGETTGAEQAEAERPAGTLSRAPVTKGPNRIFLRRAVGELSITGDATTERYEAYFHIPVPFGEQAVLWVQVQSPELVAYRYLRLGPNVIVAARLQSAPSTLLSWTAWVVVMENTYQDLPTFVPIPSPENLPDSVKAWLVATDCAQIDAPIVQETAQQLLGNTTNVIQLADDVCSYCRSIPWAFPHSPPSLDAVYALTWGNSCTGHAHAAAALLRANGVPARSLLNIPAWGPGHYFDMHWCIDYFVPDYGWVRLEPSFGEHPTPPEEEIVTFASSPEDESPLYYPWGIEGHWHTSDPALGRFNPDWGLAHSGYVVNQIQADPQQILLAHALTDSAFSYLCRYRGIPLSGSSYDQFSAGLLHHGQALEDFEAGDLSLFIQDMEQALACYRNIGYVPVVTTAFSDDFEAGGAGWTHGGEQDEWELGTPADIPHGAHSGSSCWGMDLDDTYESLADCWLLSPPIDLAGYVSATLQFSVLNWVEDRQGFDPLWVDISPDGTLFVPLSSEMGGVNDDVEIPDVGGWSDVVLDLTRHVGGGVHIRFRFKSDGNVTQWGPYIDDVKVQGCRLEPMSVETNLPGAPHSVTLSTAYPNPFTATASLRYHLNRRMQVSLGVFDAAGRRVHTLFDGEQGPGDHCILWDGRDSKGRSQASGVYYIKLGSNSGPTSRVILLR